MQKVIHREADRGKADYGWLKTAYSFSFANWYNPERMGFGVLRVINDDIVATATGFDTHSHHDMEIVTIVRKGTVTHKDSIGNTGTVKAGEVQVMSAGTGVAHSERNLSKDEPLELFQIWIEPKKLHISPRYDQKTFNLENLKNGITLLVSPDEKEGSLSINQDAYLSYAILDAKHPIGYEVKQKGNGVYILVIEGSIEVGGETLTTRDAMGISEVDEFELKSLGEAKALLIEVPMK